MSIDRLGYYCFQKTIISQLREAPRAKRDQLAPTGTNPDLLSPQKIQMMISQAHDYAVKERDTNSNNNYEIEIKMKFTDLFLKLINEKTSKEDLFQAFYLIPDKFRSFLQAVLDTASSDVTPGNLLIEENPHLLLHLVDDQGVTLIEQLIKTPVTNLPVIFRFNKSVEVFSKEALDLIDKYYTGITNRICTEIKSRCSNQSEKMEELIQEIFRKYDEPQQMLGETVSQWIAVFTDEPELLSKVLEAIAFQPDRAKTLAKTTPHWIEAFKDKPKLLAQVLEAIAKHNEAAKLLEQTSLGWIDRLKSEPESLLNVLKLVDANSEGRKLLTSYIFKWIDFYREDPKSLLKFLEVTSLQPGGLERLKAITSFFTGEPILFSWILVAIAKSSEGAKFLGENAHKDSSFDWIDRLRSKPEFLLNVLNAIALHPQCASLLRQSIFEWAPFFDGNLELLSEVLKRIIIDKEDAKGFIKALSKKSSSADDLVRVYQNILSAICWNEEVSKAVAESIPEWIGHQDASKIVKTIIKNPANAKAFVSTISEWIDLQDSFKILEAISEDPIAAKAFLEVLPNYAGAISKKDSAFFRDVIGKIAHHPDLAEELGKTALQWSAGFNEPDRSELLMAVADFPGGVRALKKIAFELKNNPSLLLLFAKVLIGSFKVTESLSEAVLEWIDHLEKEEDPTLFPQFIEIIAKKLADLSAKQINVEPSLVKLFKHLRPKLKTLSEVLQIFAKHDHLIKIIARNSVALSIYFKTTPQLFSEILKTLAEKPEKWVDDFYYNNIGPLYPIIDLIIRQPERGRAFGNAASKLIHTLKGRTPLTHIDVLDKIVLQAESAIAFGETPSNWTSFIKGERDKLKILLRVGQTFEVMKLLKRKRGETQSDVFIELLKGNEKDISEVFVTAAPLWITPLVQDPGLLLQVLDGLLRYRNGREIIENTMTTWIPALIDSPKDLVGILKTTADSPRGKGIRLEDLYNLCSLFKENYKLFLDLVLTANVMGENSASRELIRKNPDFFSYILNIIEQGGPHAYGSIPSLAANFLGYNAVHWCDLFEGDLPYLSNALKIICKDPGAELLLAKHAHQWVGLFQEDLNSLLDVLSVVAGKDQSAKLLGEGISGWSSLFERNFELFLNVLKVIASNEAGKSSLLDNFGSWGKPFLGNSKALQAILEIFTSNSFHLGHVVNVLFENIDLILEEDRLSIFLQVAQFPEGLKELIGKFSLLTKALTSEKISEFLNRVSQDDLEKEVLFRLKHRSTTFSVEIMKAILPQISQKPGLLIEVLDSMLDNNHCLEVIGKTAPEWIKFLIDKPSDLKRILQTIADSDAGKGPLAANVDQLCNLFKDDLALLSDVLTIIARSLPGKEAVLKTAYQWNELFKENPKFLLKILKTLANDQESCKILAQTLHQWGKLFSGDLKSLSEILLMIAGNRGFRGRCEGCETLARTAPKWGKLFSGDLKSLSVILKRAAKDQEGKQALASTADKWGELFRETPELLLEILKTVASDESVSVRQSLIKTAPKWVEFLGGDLKFFSEILRMSVENTQNHESLAETVPQWGELFSGDLKSLSEILLTIAGNQGLGGRYRSCEILASTAPQWGKLFSGDLKSLSVILKRAAKDQEGKQALASTADKWGELFRETPELLLEILKTISDTTSGIQSLIKTAPKWVEFLGGDLKFFSEILTTSVENTQNHAGLAETVPQWGELFIDNSESLLEILKTISDSVSARQSLIKTAPKWVEFLGGDLKFFSEILTTSVENTQNHASLAETVPQWGKLFSEDLKSLSKILKTVASDESGRDALVTRFDEWIGLFKNDSRVLQDVLKFFTDDVACAKRLGKTAPKWIHLISEKDKLPALLQIAKVPEGLGEMIGEIEGLAQVLSSEVISELIISISKDDLGIEWLATSPKWLDVLPKETLDVILPQMMKKTLNCFYLLSENTNWLNRVSSQGLKEILENSKKVRCDLSIYDRKRLDSGADSRCLKLFNKQVIDYFNQDPQPKVECFAFMNVGHCLHLLDDSRAKAVLKERVKEGDPGVYAKLISLWSQEMISKEILEDLGLFDKKFSTKQVREACLLRGNAAAFLEKLVRENLISNLDEILEDPVTWFLCIRGLSQDSVLKEFIKKAFQKAIENPLIPFYPFAMGIALASKDLQQELDPSIPKLLETPFSNTLFKDVLKHSQLNTQTLLKAHSVGLPPIDQLPKYALGFQKVAQRLRDHQESDGDFIRLQDGILQLADYLDGTSSNAGSWTPPNDQIPFMKQVLAHTLQAIDALEGKIKALKEKKSNDGTEESKEYKAAYNEALSHLSSFIILLNESINNCAIGKDAALHALESEIFARMNPEGKASSSFLLRALASVEDNFVYRLIIDYDSQSVHTLAQIKTLLKPYLGYKNKEESWDRTEEEKKALFLYLYFGFTLERVSIELGKLALQEEFKISLKSYLHERLSSEKELIEENPVLTSRSGFLFSLDQLRECEKVCKKEDEDAFRFLCLQRIRGALKKPELHSSEQKAVEVLKERNLTLRSFDELKKYLSPEEFKALEQYYREVIPPQVSSGFSRYVDVVEQMLFYSRSFEDALHEDDIEANKTPDVLRLFQVAGFPLENVHP